MSCKEALESGVEPDIDYDLLSGKHINIPGREISFNQRAIAA